MGAGGVTIRIVRTTLVVFAAVILAPLTFCVALPIGINELKAANWGWQYGRMPQPPGTKRILLRQGVEKLSNGDNCDFLLLEARSYAPEGEDEITAFYAQRPDPIDATSNPLRPQFSRDRRTPTGIAAYDDFDDEVARLYAGPYYTVEAEAIVESGPPLVDLRCP